MYNKIVQIGANNKSKMMYYNRNKPKFKNLNAPSQKRSFKKLEPLHTKMNVFISLKPNNRQMSTYDTSNLYFQLMKEWVIWKVYSNKCILDIMNNYKLVTGKKFAIKGHNWELINKKKKDNTSANTQTDSADEIIELNEIGSAIEQRPKEEIIYTSTEMVLNGIPFDKLEDDTGKILMVMNREYMSNLLQESEARDKLIASLKQEIIICVLIVSFLLYLIIGLNLGPLYLINKILTFIFPKIWIFRVSSFVISIIGVMLVSMMLANHTTSVLTNVIL